MSTSASRAMIATMISFIVASGIAVILRICARKKKMIPLKADDHLIIAAWVSLNQMADPISDLAHLDFLNSTSNY